MDTLYIIAIFVAAYFIFQMIMSRGIRQISTSELKTMLDEKKNEEVYIDVRTKGEFNGKNIKGFKNIPLDQIKGPINQIPIDKTLVLICQSGNRSSLAARKLLKAGYKNIINVKGGMNMWR